MALTDTAVKQAKPREAPGKSPEGPSVLLPWKLPDGCCVFPQTPGPPGVIVEVHVPTLLLHVMST